MYESRIKDKMIDELFEAILCLQNVDECYMFFEDVCTINEIKELAQRFKVAKMLKEKKTYNEIVEETKASTATISRVNRFLNYGSGGYNLVLNRIKAKNREEKN